jgi:hypothetical protein
MKILVIDNYDSFTYNLVHYLEKVTDATVDVFRNDKISLEEIDRYDKILLSPGPGIPSDNELVHKCDVVYHLAAAVGVRLIVEQPVHTLVTNLGGTETVLDHCNRFGKRVLVASTANGLVVKGAQIYTVHHSPYTLQFFENVPFEEVADTLAGLGHALVAVGENANLSPRFIFHHEVKDGKAMLFHGDGLALKTYMNVRVNRNETRLVLDLDDYSGWALRGAVEEFAPHQHPEAYERICRGFTAGNWGKPSRTFRFAADTWERIKPTGPARQR